MYSDEGEGYGVEGTVEGDIKDISYWDLYPRSLANHLSAFAKIDRPLGAVGR
jgi:hypothetical protein